MATYVRGLLDALQQEDRENTYRLLMDRDEADLIELVNSGFYKDLKPHFINHPLVNILWHNTVLAAAGKQFDLLHIPSARRVPLIKRTKVVATVHDLAAFSVERKYDGARMLFNRKVVPAMIRNADHVIAISQFTRDCLVRHVRYPEERITVIRSGIDHGLFQPVPPPEARDRLREIHDLDKPFFLYVARLEHPAKNHIRLIEAFERFKLDNDSAHELVLVGADWTGAEAIHARAAQSPVNGDIRFLGFVPRASLPLLYSGCDLIVFPSLFEGFGFPIIEALACGAPVVCSNTSSMQEIAADRLPTFDPFDSQAMFEQIESVVSRGWTEEQRRRGMEYASSFDWRNTARNVMEVYRSVA